MKGGGDLRQHLLAAAAQGSVQAREELVAPDLPLAGAHLWQWFLELEAARGSNGWSINPLSYTELDAWARLTRRRPNPIEIEALRALDRARLEAARPPEEGRK